MHKPIVVLSFLALIAALAVPTAASAALGELSLISRADGFAGALGDGNSYTNERSISADGRYIAFLSYADNLGGPYAAERNVYRRDTLLGRTELVSRANGLNGAVGDDNSFSAEISADGNRIAFVSAADNLSGADDNTYTNIFVRDMTAGVTTLASRASGVAGDPANQSSLIPKISGDGNVVGFQSLASNIDPTVTDNNAAVDTYVRDLTNSTTRLVSKSTAGVIGNDLTTVGDISFDGNLVTMDSQATTLGGNVTGASSNVYVRNRSAATTTLVSQPTGNSNVSGANEAGASTITDAGDRIAFVSRSGPLVPDAPLTKYATYVRDLTNNTTTLVSRAASGALADTDVFSPVISSDGSILTFLSAATNLDGATGGVKQAFVRDLATGQTQLISRAGRVGAPANALISSTTPGRSSRLVLFEANATNLAPEANGPVYQLFMRDVKVIDPIPPVTISGKSFKTKLSKKSFTVKATTGGGATRISGKATLRVSKKIVKSGRIVVKLKPRTVASTLTSHKLRFTLSKKQNRFVLKALKTKKSRVKLSVELSATGAGTPGAARFSGKLRR
ncbi:MAG: PD40 domain-containing protein [Thermoleophilaceae bacterium]|nr:PD40 domain-containing protein [Thermoleophilaceae bacterium]